ncbi:MAG: nitroreductase family protein [Oscillospiraceae bacterium]|jgi:nitroreductase|nr:nitroreductase family protein [Oscillospiraceae bacterium]
MEFFECVQNRYSYRGAYKSTPVPRENMEKIIKAGLAAPSGCNTQTTSIIGIDDKQILVSIANIVKKNGFKGTLAPAGVCILTQEIPGYADVYFNVQDYSAAIENMLLAITALGYASCWIEGQITESEETQKQIADILKIPKNYIVIGFLPIGVPESEGKRASYKPFSERAWYNVYGSSE